MFVWVTVNCKTGSRISADFHGLSIKKNLFQHFFRRTFCKKRSIRVLRNSCLEKYFKHSLEIAFMWMAAFTVDNSTGGLFVKEFVILPATLLKNKLLKKYISSFLTTSAEKPISRATLGLLLSNMLF